MSSWSSAGGGREQNDGQAVISTGEGVPPPAGHYLSTGQLLQQQTDTHQVCEGEVSQVCPSCCCQTAQPALLPVDLTVYRTHFWFALSGQFFNIYIHYLYLEMKVHCHTVI